MLCFAMDGVHEQGLKADIIVSVEDEPETIIRYRDAGCDNIATDTDAFFGGTGKLKTYVKHLTMGDAKPPLTTHILDTARGIPAANVPMVLSIQNPDGSFTELERNSTNNDGRGGFLAGSMNWKSAVYRLHFDTDSYFISQNIAGFYPYVEVVFRITDPNQHYHVPILLSPFGYSTYRGS